MNINELFYSLKNESSKWNNYLEVYETHLTKYINTRPNILEIGIAKGGSLEFWSKFFNNGKIFGVDIYEDCKKYESLENNIFVEIGDQSSDLFWHNFSKNKEQFDVIIDDGSHITDHQIKTLFSLFPSLKENGTYIIEDTHTSYWTDYNGGFRHPRSFVEFTKQLIDLLHRQHIGVSPPKEFEIFSGLSNISYYNSIVVLTKKSNITNHPIFSNTF